MSVYNYIVRAFRVNAEQAVMKVELHDRSYIVHIGGQICTVRHLWVFSMCFPLTSPPVEKTEWNLNTYIVHVFDSGEILNTCLQDPALGCGDLKGISQKRQFLGGFFWFEFLG